jgi:hypothetical protein
MQSRPGRLKVVKTSVIPRNPVASFSLPLQHLVYLDFRRTTLILPPVICSISGFPAAELFVASLASFSHHAPVVCLLSVSRLRIGFLRPIYLQGMSAFLLILVDGVFLYWCGVGTHEAGFYMEEILMHVAIAKARIGFSALAVVDAANTLQYTFLCSQQVWAWMLGRDVFSCLGHVGSKLVRPCGTNLVVPFELSAN